MSKKQGQLTQYLQIDWFLAQMYHYMCVWSLQSRLSQFRMVLEICYTEFSLQQGVYDIDWPLATLTATCFYANNDLN